MYLYVYRTTNYVCACVCSCIFEQVEPIYLMALSQILDRTIIATAHERCKWTPPTHTHSLAPKREHAHTYTHTNTRAHTHIHTHAKQTHCTHTPHTHNTYTIHTHTHIYKITQTQTQSQSQTHTKNTYHKRTCTLNFILSHINIQKF